jgi:hypothetical protein
MGVFNRNRTVNAFEVDPDDPMFLRPEEHTFIFFGASHSIVRMLSGKKENYTAGTIGFREVGLRPTDLVGKPCSASRRPVEEIHTACVGIHQNHVKFLFHESEFPAWFAAQDKDSLKPYRFVRPRKRTMVVDGGSFKIQINNGEKIEEYTFEGLTDIPYSAVAALATPESRLDPRPGGDAGSASGLASLVGAPSLVSSVSSISGETGMSSAGETGVDAGWRGGGGSAGMSEMRDLAASRSAGMTMAGEAIIPGAAGIGTGAGGGHAVGFGGGTATTQTMVVCPHCAKPIMFSFQATKIGGSE